MTGTSGHSGGARQGAGRPCKRVSFAMGDKLLLRTITPEGPMLGDLGTIIELSRNHVTLKMKNGDTVTITR